ncbi:MAG: threonylcarbamoyl-AMP synthase [Bacteroidetes bacterium]|nr:MAG: threonylcarbamoyl-AMP synthase [Bacteroidota bacterium]
MMKNYEADISNAVEVLRNGGTILYPTDTVWGLGCDATNEDAVQKIFEIKKRGESKTMIVLVADETDIMKFVASPDPAIFDYIDSVSRPTTIIYENAIGLASNLIAENGSIAIRLTRDEFCKHLIKRLRGPIVSTSANISGEATPSNFGEISNEIIQAVDYVVKFRQNDRSKSVPSAIVKWERGELKIIRE